MAPQLIRYGNFILIAAVVGLLGWQYTTINSLREQVRAVGMVADSVEAANDTTRLVADQYRRRAVQTEIERDSLARALRERPVVETTVTINPEPVVDTVEVVAVGDTILSSRFEDDLFIADVSFKLRIDDTWIASWNVDVQPVEMLVGIRCGPVSETTGIRPVQVTAQAEPWEVSISDSRVDPDVCNAAAPDTHSSFLKGVGAGALAILTLAIIL